MPLFDRLRPRYGERVRSAKEPLLVNLSDAPIGRKATDAGQDELRFHRRTHTSRTANARA